jgi:hypothetical protein
MASLSSATKTAGEDQGLAESEFAALADGVRDVFLAPQPLSANGSLLRRLQSCVQTGRLSTDLVLTLPRSEFNARVTGLKLSTRRHGALQRALRSRRLAVRLIAPAPHLKPVLFTAPHTLSLQRDGRPVHKCEVHTRYLAVAFAEAAHGASLTWSEREVARVSAHYRADPPRSNRDPNFLTDGELDGSPWFHAMRTCKHNACHVLGQAPAARSLHCDVHGMSDASVPGVDCVFGTAAMEQHHGRQRAARFRDNLKRFVGDVLATFPPTFEYRTLATQEREVLAGAGGSTNAWTCCTDCPMFTGAAEQGRNTLSQMSSDVALWNRNGGDEPFAFSVQIELSRSLRELLRHPDNCELLRAFAQALWKSVELLEGDDGD